MHRIAVKKHNYIVLCKNVPTTCFGHFKFGRQQVGYNTLFYMVPLTMYCIQPDDGLIRNGRNM